MARRLKILRHLCAGWSRSHAITRTMAAKKRKRGGKIRTPVRSLSPCCGGVEREHSGELGVLLLYGSIKGSVYTCLLCGDAWTGFEKMRGEPSNRRAAGPSGCPNSTCCHTVANAMSGVVQGGMGTYHWLEMEWMGACASGGRMRGIRCSRMPPIFNRLRRNIQVACVTTQQSS